MSILGKLMDSMRLNDTEDEDDYYLDDDYEDDSDKHAKKPLFSKKTEDEYTRKRSMNKATFLITLS